MIRSSANVERLFFNDTATTEIYALSLRDALPISEVAIADGIARRKEAGVKGRAVLVKTRGQEAEGSGAGEGVDVVRILYHRGSGRAVEVVDDAQDIARIRRPSDDGRHASQIGSAHV